MYALGYTRYLVHYFSSPQCNVDNIKYTATCSWFANLAEITSPPHFLNLLGCINAFFRAGAYIQCIGISSLQWVDGGDCNYGFISLGTFPFFEGIFFCWLLSNFF